MFEIAPREEVLAGIYHNSDLAHGFFSFILSEKTIPSQRIYVVLDLWLIGNCLTDQEATKSLSLLGCSEDVVNEFQRFKNNNNEIRFYSNDYFWNQIEDDRLVYFVLRSRSINWEKAAKYVRNRSCDSCRWRWFTHFHPILGKRISNRVSCCICSGDRVLILKEPEDPHKTCIKSDKLTVSDDIKIYTKKLKQKTLEAMNLKHKLQISKETSSSLLSDVQNLKNQLRAERSKVFSFLDNDVSAVVEHNFIQRNSRYNRRYEIDDKLFWVKQLIRGNSHFLETTRILKGPARSTVYEWLKLEEFQVPSENLLTNINNIDEVLDFWAVHYGLCQNECISLAYDAIAFDIDLVLEEDGIKWGVKDKINLEEPTHKYKENPSLYEELFNKLKADRKLIGAAFIVMVLPLSHHRPFVCHIFYHNSGSAIQEIIDNIKKIESAIMKRGFIYCGNGFDADPFYNQMQIDYFDDWSKFLNSPSSCQVHKLFSLNHQNLFNDPSHILKRLRKRFVAYDNLVIIPSGNFITVKKFRELFPHIPDSVFENNNLVTMNDWHPSRIFNASNAAQLIIFTEEDQTKDDIYGLTIFIIIGTTMNCLLRSKKLNREQQLILAYSGLFSCLWGYSTLMSNTYSKKKRFLMTKNMLIHAANYFYCIIGIFAHVRESFSIGRLGSIVLEHFFGRVRMASGGENTHKKFVSSLNRLQVLDKYKDQTNTKIPYRWFETGLVQVGTSILDLETCVGIMTYTRDLFTKSGFKLQKKCAFYEIQSDVKSQNIGRELLLSVLKSIEQNERNNLIVSKGWSLHSSSINLGRKKGRNIVNRFHDQK